MKRGEASDLSRLYPFLIAAGLVVFFFGISHQLRGDDIPRFEALTLLLTGKGLVRMKWSFWGTLFWTPLWLLGRVFISPPWWCARFNFFLLGGTLWYIHRLLRGKLDPAILNRFLLILLACSMFPSHLRDASPEVFTSACVLIGIVLIAFWDRIPGWLLMLAGLINTPASLFGFCLSAAYQSGLKKRWRYGLWIPAGGALLLLDRWIRLGSPFVSGYENDHGYKTLMPYSGLPGFSYPFLLGFLGIAFSFGKGLLFFSPGLLLYSRRKLLSAGREMMACWGIWMSYLAGLIFLYSRWWGWYGGWGWGSRYFLFASIPASLLLAVRLHSQDRTPAEKIFVFIVLTLSVWVGLNGSIAHLSDFNICQANGYALEFLCHYVPEYSVLWHISPGWLHPAPQIAAVFAYFMLVYAVLALPLLHAIFNDLRSGLRSLAQWRF